MHAPITLPLNSFNFSLGASVVPSFMSSFPTTEAQRHRESREAHFSFSLCASVPLWFMLFSASLLCRFQTASGRNQSGFLRDECGPDYVIPFQPQRHRDTEEAVKLWFGFVSPCLCVSVVHAFMLFPASRLCRFQTAIGRNQSGFLPDECCPDTSSARTPAAVCRRLSADCAPCPASALCSSGNSCPARTTDTRHNGRFRR